MDGFEGNEGIIVIAAQTVQVFLIQPSPSRTFDRKVLVGRQMLRDAKHSEKYMLEISP